MSFTVGYDDRCGVDVLTGKTLAAVEQVDYYGDAIVFTVVPGERYLMWHESDCCESVNIEDINGDLQSLVGVPIVLAEESTSTEDPAPPRQYGPDSYTWTFYRFRTAKGDVDIRWFGESNGYYSEAVNFGRIKEQATGWDVMGRPTYG